MMSERSSVHSTGPGACLDDLLISRFLPKRWIGRLWSADELPSRLKRCAGNLAPGSEWRAYGEEGQIFFAIARMHAADAPERADPHDGSETAIDAYFLDANAAVYAAGVWEYSRRNGWWLDAVMELSYDCDHGWWPEAVVGAGHSRDTCSAALRPGVLDIRRLNAPASRPTAAGGRVARRGKVRN